MNNTIYYLRHAQTRIDLARPGREWQLSVLGEQQAQNLVLNPIFRDLDAIICSTERKTFLTAQYLAQSLNKSIQTHKGLNEIGSEGLPLQNTQEFNKRRLDCFKDLDECGTTLPDEINMIKGRADLRDSDGLLSVEAFL